MPALGCLPSMLLLHCPELSFPLCRLIGREADADQADPAVTVCKENTLQSRREAVGCLLSSLRAVLMISVQIGPIAVQDARLGGRSGPLSSSNALQSYCGVGTAACWGPSREAQQVRGADIAAASRWLSAAAGSWHLERCIGQSFWPSPWCTVTLMCLQDTLLSAQHWCMCQFAC